MNPTAQRTGVTWADLVRREPRLIPLLTEAVKQHRDTDSHYCANGKWYGFGKYRDRGLKPRLVRLVGIHAESSDPVLHTSEAYDVAYQRVYDALPNCRDCGCW